MSTVNVVYCDSCGDKVTGNEYWTMQFEGPTARSANGKLIVGGNLRLRSVAVSTADVCTGCIAALSTDK